MSNTQKSEKLTRRELISTLALFSLPVLIFLSPLVMFAVQIEAEKDLKMKEMEIAAAKEAREQASPSPDDTNGTTTVLSRSRRTH